MKRSITTILGVILIASIFVGCTKSGSTSVKTDETLTTDVLVIGGGGAGMTAALTVAEAGKNVILIEKMGYMGGATMMSGGIVPATNTTQQASAGIEDSVELFARDIFRPNHYNVRQDLVYTVTEKADDVVVWLESLGIKMTLITEFLYHGQSNYRMHVADGKGLGITNAMIANINENDKITVLLNTTGKSLIDENGVVVGAIAQGADKTYTIKATNTILATSGFAANDEMIAQYIPEMSNAFKLVAPGATGEGILWGEELGAKTANMKSYQGHGTYSEAFGGSADLFALYRGGILVNQTGDRFTNEHMGYSELAPHVLAQPGNYAYMIINQDNATQTASFESYLEKNIVISANTAEELAEKLNLNTDIFLETVREYQEGIVKGEDRFNRTNMPAHFNGPYHAIKITGDIRHTQGGLVTDIAGHVLREDGSLIKGLYAAGGVTESFSSVAGPGYMSGNGLLQAFVFGREAGFAASKETPNTATVVNWVNENQPTVENTEAVTNMVDTNTLTYKDGTYEGVAKGQYDGIKVQVKVVGGKVDSVVVLEHFETEAIYATAYKTILSGILANNGSSNVDAVTGATNSSKGILEAVNIALKNAL